MKTYILLTLALMSFASATHSQNKPFLLVKVLFYNDGKGHQMPAAGHVPKKVNKAIRKDIMGRLGNSTGEVVVTPLLYHLATAPPASEIKTFVRKTFLHIYSVEIPSWLASQIVNKKSKKNTSRNMKIDGLDGERHLAHDTHNNEEALNTNLISDGKNGDTSINHINHISKVPKPYYLPNTVFYAVETKCKIPTDYSCFLHLRYQHKVNATHPRTFKKMFEKTSSMHSKF